MNSPKKHFAFLIFLSLVMSVFTGLFSHMNNWLIFKHSFFHLVEGKNLYALYPEKATDVFMYSPTFALFMAPLAWLPDLTGATLWNLFGAILLVKALDSLPVNAQHKKAIFWISLPEFIGSTQNFQSNIHMIALFILFWVGLEKKEQIKPSLYVLSTFFIKIYGLAALGLFNRSLNSKKDFGFALKFFATFMTGFVILGLSPLLVTDFDQLMGHYRDWMTTHQNRSGVQYGFSLMGVIHGFTDWPLHNLSFQLVGLLSLLVSLVYFRKGDQTSRLMDFVAICYFLVVFNHGAESPTFIIAMVAFGIHQAYIKNQRLRWAAIAFTLGCVSLLYADPFRPWSPHFNHVAVKVWPFLFLYPMVTMRLGLIKAK